MWLTDAVGMAAESAFYLGSIGYLLGRIGPCHALPRLFGIFWGSQLLGLLTRKRRYGNGICLLPALWAFGSSFGKAERVLLLPLFLMLGLRLRQKNWTMTYDRLTTDFQAGGITAVLLTALCALAGFPASFMTEAVPMFFGAVLLTILGLRLLRAQDLLEDGRYRLLNVLLMLLLGLGLLLLGSRTCVDLVTGVLKLFYLRLISPLLQLIFMIVVGIPAFLLYLLISWLMSLRGDVEAPQMSLQSSAMEFAELTGQEAAEPVVWLEKLATAFLILCFAAAAWYGISRLMRQRRPETGSGADVWQREKLPAAGKKKGRRSLFSGQPEDSIRRSYRRYLLLCRNREIPVDGRIASDRICEESGFLGKEKERKLLREKWMEVRYGDQTTDAQTAAAVKAIVRGFVRAEKETLGGHMPALTRFHEKSRRK